MPAPIRGADPKRERHPLEGGVSSIDMRGWHRDPQPLGKTDGRRQI